MPWDPMKGERLAPAWTAALKLLDDGAWHSWSEVTTAMLNASDLLPSTCSGLLYEAVKRDILERTGNYSARRKQRDKRKLRRVSR